MSDDNSATTNHSLADGLLQAVSDISHDAEDGDWSAPLWENNWKGDVGHIGEAHLRVAAKRWGDGTVDVLVAHYPEDEDSMPTAYAHRHSKDVTPLTVDGPADKVVETVTRTWGPPQAIQTP